jgi:hypothetical protein
VALNASTVYCTMNPHLSPRAHNAPDLPIFFQDALLFLVFASSSGRRSSHGNGWNISFCLQRAIKVNTWNI